MANDPEFIAFRDVLYDSLTASAPAAGDASPLILLRRPSSRLMPGGGVVQAADLHGLCRVLNENIVTFLDELLAEEAERSLLSRRVSPFADG